MNEIIIYQPAELSQKIEVRVENETVWLSQLQMVELFRSTKQNISLHINNIFREGELIYSLTVKEYLTVKQEGNRKVKRKVKYYNLDVIISVGYRVKSFRGTQFRQWANQILKDYLLKGYAVSRRVGRIEDDVHQIKDELGEIRLQLNTSLTPEYGIFFQGQIFDAYTLIADIIRSASNSVVLIDNYIDDSVLKQLGKRRKNIKAVIYSKTNSKTFLQDLEKYNQQYPRIELRKLTGTHDRFLIIDHETVYHFGASLKDAGKKLFAFSVLPFKAEEVIKIIE